MEVGDEGKWEMQEVERTQKREREEEGRELI